MKEKILIISPQKPSNPNGGAKILKDRFNLLSKDYDLFLIARDKNIKNLSELNYFKKIKLIKKTKPINFILFFLRYIIITNVIMYTWIIKYKIKIIQLEFYDNLIYSLFLFPLRLFNIKIYYNANDLQCTYYNPKSLKYKITRNIETTFFKWFIDKIFVWGNDDEKELNNWRINKLKIKIIHPIIIKYGGQIWKTNKENNFVFMGSYNHKPNQDSINYIIEDIWPRIKEQIPNAKLYLIIGDNKKINNKDPSIINCGFVKDPEKILSRCKLFIAPIISGTGIKIKIIESFKLGIPLISTKLGFKNFDNLDKKRILIAKNKNDFIKKIISAVNNKEELNKISQYEKEYFDANFGIENIELYKKYYSAAN